MKTKRYSSSDYLCRNKISFVNIFMMLATLVQLAGPHKAFISNGVGPELRIGGHQFGQSSPDELSTAMNFNRSAQLL